MSGSATRLRNPRGEGGRLREQLVQATAELLDELGDAARLSIRAIARRAGVSPTAFYLHFPDLDAIVSAAVDAGFDAFNAALLSAAQSETNALASLTATSQAYLAFAERQPALYAVLFSARRPPVHQGMPSPTGDGHDQGFAGLVALLRRADPALDEPEAVELAVAVWSSLHGFAMLRAARPKLGWPSADAYVRRMLAALVPREAAPRGTPPRIGRFWEVH